MVRILIVEDSPVMKELLVYTLNTDPDIEIVGTANNGEEAIELVVKTKPDVIAMDWQMPKLDGKQATKIIMETIPTPIVIVTGSMANYDVAVSFSLMEAGALAIVKKPVNIAHPDYKKDSRELIKTLKLMSEVKVIKRYSRKHKLPAASNYFNDKSLKTGLDIELVVIGASTGGPQVLQKMILGLPVDFPVPILIVQHIAKGFVEGFVNWLSNTTKIPIHIAIHGACALPGHIYIAPDAFHLGVEKGPCIVLSNQEPVNGLKPSVAFLYRTAALNFQNRVVGILLTGMGRDGAEELKLIKDLGGITFAQSKESSIVFGMPGEAIKLEAATYILSPEEIIIAISALFKRTKALQNEK